MSISYQPVIGLEIHAQLQTNSKIFASDPVLFGQEANTLISPISLGHPGTLPKLNKKVVEFVSSIILEINPTYEFPNMLISTMIEGSNQQRFFAAHLPRLTNMNQNDDLVESFFTETLLKVIKHG